MRTGHLFVISGPSGVGKGTIIRELFARPNADELWFSVSATTREPRESEKEGIAYYFVNDSTFDELVATDGMLEWANVYRERYGTPRASVEDRLATGLDVILDIDTQGAAQVVEHMPEAITIFIEPPSLGELERRIRMRGANTEEQIEFRLGKAKDEIAQKERYNYTVVNDSLETAVAQVAAIVEENRCR